MQEPSNDHVEAWRALYEAAGGRARLAERLEVDESTLYRWSREHRAPSRIVRNAVNAVCDELGVAHVFTEERKEDTHA